MLSYKISESFQVNNQLFKNTLHGGKKCFQNLTLITWKSNLVIRKKHFTILVLFFPLSLKKMHYTEIQLWLSECVIHVSFLLRRLCKASGLLLEEDFCCCLSGCNLQFYRQFTLLPGCLSSYIP